jgi:hypothetical protein
LIKLTQARRIVHTSYERLRCVFQCQHVHLKPQVCGCLKDIRGLKRVDVHIYVQRRAITSISVQPWWRGVYTANGGNIQISADILPVSLVYPYEMFTDHDNWCDIRNIWIYIYIYIYIIIYIYIYIYIYILWVCTRNHWYFCVLTATYHFIPVFSLCICSTIIVLTLNTYEGLNCLMSNTHKIKINNWYIAHLYLIQYIRLLLNAQPSLSPTLSSIYNAYITFWNCLL